MKNKGDKIKGIIGTIVYHALVLIALLFLGLSTPLPLPGEEGVEVNLGNSDIGSGFVQQTIPEEVPSIPEKEEEIIKQEQEEQKAELPPEKPKTEEKVAEEVIQQETEEAPPLPKPVEKKAEPKKEDIKPVVEKPLEKVEEKKPEPVVNPNALYKKKEVEKEPDPVVNPNALYKKSNTTDAKGTNQGITKGIGDQGQLHGTPESLNYEGLGGEGEGISYSLAGRGAKVLPKPTYNSPEQGRVVVSIWVNRQGDVVRAVDGAKGTNISDLNLRRLAREAALRAKFSEDPTATDLQKGTITYNFIRIN